MQDSLILGIDLTIHAQFWVFLNTRANDAYTIDA